MLVPRTIFHLHEACDPDSARFAIGGVYFTRARDGTPRAVATDGRRIIAARWLEASADEFPSVNGVDPSPNGGGFKAVIPKAFCRKAPKLADPGRNNPKPILANIALDEHGEDKDGNGVTQVNIGATDLEEGIFQMVRTIEGRFIHWTEHYPKLDGNDTVTVPLDAKLLSNTLATMLKTRAERDDCGERSVYLMFRVESEEVEEEVRECTNCGWSTEKFWCEECTAKTEPRRRLKYKPVDTAVVLAMRPDGAGKEVCGLVMPLTLDDSPRRAPWIPNGSDAGPAVNKPDQAEPKTEPEPEPTFSVETALHVVADSWEKLRPVDLERLLEDADRRSTLAAAIIEHRPDLRERVLGVLSAYAHPSNQDEDDEDDQEADLPTLVKETKLSETVYLTAWSDGTFGVSEVDSEGQEVRRSYRYPDEVSARIRVMRGTVEWED